MELVRACNLYRFFHTGDDEVFALRGVDLVAASGEFLAITGPSGSGKSTLLACLAGLDEPDGGFVEIAGRRMTQRPESVKANIRARLLGIVLQSGNLFSHLTVAENVGLQRRLAKVEGAEDVEDLLRSVGLAHRATALSATLSGGEAARAALAVALAARPSVLLCDEPTGEIDAATESSILATLKAEQAKGTTVIVATHSTALAARADRVVHLLDGSIQ